MPDLREVEDNVVLRLKAIDQDRQKFFSELNKNSQGIIQVENQSSIFDIKNLKCALEHCEDEAFAEEDKIKVDVKTQEVKEEGDVKEECKESEKFDGASFVSDLRHEINLSLSKMDKCYEDRKHDFLYHKQKEFEEHRKKLRLASLEKLKRSKETREKEKLQMKERVKQYFIECEETRKRLEEEHRRKKLVISQKFKNRQEEAEKRLRIKIQQGQDRLVKARRVKHDCDDTSAKLTQHLNTTKFSCFTKHPVVAASMVSLQEIMDFVNKHTSSELDTCDPEILDVLEQYGTKFHETVFNLKNTIDKLKIEKEKEDLENEKRLKEMRRKEEIAIQKRKEKEKQEKNPELSLPPVPRGFELSVSRGAYQRHVKLTAKLNEHLEAHKNVVAITDKQVKRSVSDVKKLMSIAFSSIIDRAGSDIKNCLKDLNGMLEGNNMTVMNRTLNLNNIPQGLAYARLQLAQSFVKQSIVSTNATGAFPLALAIVGVWVKDPTFGDLYLAHLHTKCPFALPMYPVKTDSQTVEDYSRARGYIIGSDSRIEEQELYMKRMSGMIRTYAAIIQSPTPPGCRVHPHGIENGWLWLTRILNMEPWKELTATLLYDFLDVAGHAMHAAYGKQFFKLLELIQSKFIAKIEECQNGQHRAPTERLKKYIQECGETLQAAKPEGHLEKSFWSTYHTNVMTGG